MIDIRKSSFIPSEGWGTYSKMSDMNKIHKIAQQILRILMEIVIEILKILREEFKKLFSNLIEKIHFSITFKITVVYARRTLSILLFLGLLVMGGFIVFSGWMAQENMRADLQLVEDYLKEGGSSEERIRRLAELHEISISIFREGGDLLLTTEEEPSMVNSNDGEKPTRGWDINNNLIVVGNQSPIDLRI